MEQKVCLDTASLVRQVRKKRPLVHCITNAVTVNDCANLLLAAGASPTMAHHVLEVEEVTAGCDALVCNLGATDAYDAMQKAVIQSSISGHPIVVDPVGAGGSSFRRRYWKELSGLADITCIRGNASEIKALAMDCATITGVDAKKEDTDIMMEETIEMSARLSARTGSIVIASGEKDIVTDGKTGYLLKNGHPIMSHITGTGCMSAVLLGAFLAAIGLEADLNMKLAACLTAVTMMNVCGELAAITTENEKNGPMAFRMHLIDEVYRLDPLELERRGVICRL